MSENKANYRFTNALYITVLIMVLLFCQSLCKAALWIDSAGYSSFSAAVNAASGKTLAIARQEVLDRPITVPSNVHLMFLNGGTILKSSNYTLKISGPLTAPVSQIFSGFAPGNVTFPLQTVDCVYPQWWGAKADGVTDDKNAIQCTLRSNSTCVYFPKGDYLINSALDITDFGNSKLVIAGAGCAGSGTNIIGNTGGIVLDTTGTRHISFRDFNIVAGSSNPSTVGILLARSVAFSCVEFTDLKNVGIHLTSIPSANNGNGTVAIYNLAAEIWRACDLNLDADTGIVFTGNNIYNIMSPFKTYGEWSSMSVCTIDGASVIKSRKGPCVAIENAARIEIHNTLFCGDNSVINPFEYAVKIVPPGYWPSAITITGRKDRPGGWLYVAGCILQDLHLRGTGQDQGTAIYLSNSAEIHDGEISICPLPNSGPSTLISAPQTGKGITNVEIQLFENQKINVPYRQFSGNIVRTSQTKNQTGSSIIVPSNASYLLLTSDGVKAVGQR